MPGDNFFWGDLFLLLAPEMLSLAQRKPRNSGFFASSLPGRKGGRFCLKKEAKRGSRDRWKCLQRRRAALEDREMQEKGWESQRQRESDREKERERPKVNRKIVISAWPSKCEFHEFKLAIYKCPIKSLQAHSSKWLSDSLAKCMFTV